MFIAALCTIAKRWKQTECPSMDKWTKKIWYIHTVGYYSALRMKAVLSHAAPWVNFEDIMLSETSQSQKDNI